MCSTNVEENAGKGNDFLKIVFVIFNTKTSARKLYLFGRDGSNLIAKSAILCFTDRKPPPAPNSKGTWAGKRKTKQATLTARISAAGDTTYWTAKRTTKCINHISLKQTKTNTEKRTQTNPTNCIFILLQHLRCNKVAVKDN